MSVGESRRLFGSRAGRTPAQPPSSVAAPQDQVKALVSALGDAQVGLELLLRSAGSCYGQGRAAAAACSVDAALRDLRSVDGEPAASQVGRPRRGTPALNVWELSR